MKLMSWNVNGIRSVLGKGFLDFVKKEDPEILCLQEIKIDVEVDINFPDRMYAYWNHAQKKGYSGTAMFCKRKPIDVTYGMKMEHHDGEGRIITAEYEKYYIINVYTPNSQRGLTRLKYRQEWNEDFLKFVKKLGMKKPVIFCGDLNVAHKEIDLANPKQNRKNAGFTDEERADFDKMINAGFIDTFREFHNEAGQYSWWSYMFNARAKNIGWRIDYFMISKSLRDSLKDAGILQKYYGSDHCPVYIELKE